MRQDASGVGLTPREEEVFSLVVTGRQNKVIAGDLGMSEKTVKVHRARVMQKMQAESIVDLVRFADMLGGIPRVMVHIVDDDPSIRKAVLRLLRLEGISAREYESAEDFLAQADLSQPGCVILDRYMPGMDGLNLQKMLEESALKIIMISAEEPDSREGTLPLKNPLN